MMTRQKILPEDMIQKTNLRQHNLMIDAINEVDIRQGTVEDMVAANNIDVATLKGNFITLSNEKLGKADIDKDLHFGVITLTREGTSVMASMDVYNPVTGVITPIGFTIPGATSSMAGVMPADDAAWIAEAEGRISALEGMSNVKALVGLPEEPTQAEINSAWMSETARAPETGDLAQDVSNAKLWIFVVDRWVLHGVVVTVPVATTTSLGGVKDTALEVPANRWYCHVEADGRVALIGGDSLSALLDTAIPAMQVGLAQKADKTEVNDELALKADKTEVNDALALKADKTYVEDKIIEIHFGPPIDCSALLTMYNGDTALICTPPINAKYCVSLREVFRNCPKLALVGDIHCPNVTDTAYMFYDCSSLKTIPSLNTSNVTNMSAMFYGCSSLTSVPILDTSKVTNMGTMFYGCSSLTSVTFQCADVRPYAGSMFYNTPIASGSGRIYVPDNLVQAYKTASGWSAHANVIFGHSDKP